MIKTKQFIYIFPDYDNLPLDTQINQWLEDNQNINVIDIKYQSNTAVVADSGICVQYLYDSALIIYKEIEK